MTTKKKVLGVDPLSWISEKEKNKSIKIEDIVAKKEKKTLAKSFFRILDCKAPNNAML